MRGIRDRLDAGGALVLGHLQIYGPVDDENLWIEIDQLLRSKWRHPSGGFLRVDAAAIDCGDGQHFDRVIQFCAPRASRKILATKGVAGKRPTLAPSHSKMKHGGRLWLVGVDQVKSLVFGKLARGRTIRFSDTLSEDYYDQVCSEKLVTRYSRGKPSRRFERISGRRAEGLDCLCYGFAARQAVTVQLDQRAAILILAGSAAFVRVRLIESGWMWTVSNW
jgi:phage terminase large subunit GpA-like protein